MKNLLKYLFLADEKITLHEQISKTKTKYMPKTYIPKRVYKMI